MHFLSSGTAGERFCCQPEHWSGIEIEPVGFIRLSDTSATIAYDCKAKGKDGKLHHALASSGYIKREDGWKLATHQQTEMPEKA